MKSSQTCAGKGDTLLFAAWSGKYPVLKTYQSEVDIPAYSCEIRRLLDKLQEDYGYSDLDAMLVLKDILAHEYMDNRKK